MTNYEFIANENGSFEISIGDTTRRYNSTQNDINNMIELLLQSTTACKSAEEVKHIKDEISSKAKTKESVSSELAFYNQDIIKSSIQELYSQDDLTRIINAFEQKASNMRDYEPQTVQMQTPQNNIELAILELSNNDYMLLDLFRKSTYNITTMYTGVQRNVMRLILQSDYDDKTKVSSIKLLVGGLDYQHVRYLSGNSEIFNEVADIVYATQIKRGIEAIKDQYMYNYITTVKVYERDGKTLTYDEYKANMSKYDADNYSYFDIAIRIGTGFNHQMMLSDKVNDPDVQLSDKAKETIKRLLLANACETDIGIILNLIKANYKPAIKKHQYSSYDRVRLEVAKVTNEMQVLEYLSFDEKTSVREMAVTKLNKLN